mmetsp:Transcript_50451/g.116452  ORF Transcript_50451/g.116452 Transcript_50451/m.116452 type:complete len:230 (-) Transcript_50451:54-743(-)
MAAVMAPASSIGLGFIGLISPICPKSSFGTSGVPLLYTYPKPESVLIRRQVPAERGDIHVVRRRPPRMKSTCPASLREGNRSILRITVPTTSQMGVRCIGFTSKGDSSKVGLRAPDMRWRSRASRIFSFATSMAAILFGSAAYDSLSSMYASVICSYVASSETPSVRYQPISSSSAIITTRTFRVPPLPATSRGFKTLGTDMLGAGMRGVTRAAPSVVAGGARRSAAVE